jgi:hypothetical protein
MRAIFGAIYLGLRAAEKNPHAQFRKKCFWGNENAQRNGWAMFFYLYFQNDISRRVNRQFSRDYFDNGFSNIAGIVQVQGLDIISGLFACRAYGTPSLSGCLPRTCARGYKTLPLRGATR